MHKRTHVICEAIKLYQVFSALRDHEHDILFPEKIIVDARHTFEYLDFVCPEIPFKDDA